MEGKEIKVSNFGSFQDFLDYAERHYLPLLERLTAKGSVPTEEERRLIGFLHDDLVSMVNSSEVIE